MPSIHIASRMTACLEQQRLHFSTMLAKLRAFEPVPARALPDQFELWQAEALARTQQLEDEFGTLQREWESATVPRLERDRVRLLATEVARLVHELESRFASMMAGAGEEMGHVRAELQALQRGRGLLRKMHAPTDPVPGYLDRSV